MSFEYLDRRAGRLACDALQRTPKVIGEGFSGIHLDDDSTGHVILDRGNPNDRELERTCSGRRDATGHLTNFAEVHRC
jgi:hypothetical protein